MHKFFRLGLKTAFCDRLILVPSFLPHPGDDLNDLDDQGGQEGQQGDLTQAGRAEQG